MKYSSRFFLYAPLGAFLLLVLVVGVHWWIAASTLSSRLAAANGREIAPGITMHFATRRITGFPFTLDTVLHDVTFQVATPHGPASWTTKDFAMHALTYGRDETIFEAAGAQTLRWTRDDGSKRTLDFAVGSLHASAIVNRKGLARFDLDLVEFGSRALTAQRFQFHLRRDAAHTALDAIVEADDVRFSPADQPDFGGQIAAARFSATIGGADAFGQLLSGGQRWFDAVEGWRAAGGTLQVDRCSLMWGGMSVEGTGTLSLDKAHRPQGALGFEIGGFNHFQQRVDEKNLPRGANKGLAAALAMRGGDAAGHASAVLAFRNGIVWLGGLPADTVTPLY